MNCFLDVDGEERTPCYEDAELKNFMERVSNYIKQYAAVWKLHEAGINNPGAGVSSDHCEPLRRLLQDLSDCNELSVDIVVMSFYYLSNHFIRDIHGAYYGPGSFRLTVENRHLTLGQQ